MKEKTPMSLTAFGRTTGELAGVVDGHVQKNKDPLLRGVAELGLGLGGHRWALHAGGAWEASSVDKTVFSLPFTTVANLGSTHQWRCIALQ
uniref:Uncharacterized protein n=1 Tax=Oryza brachyantha TaxID=4533 RepID=J3N2N2_ORYBR